MEREKPNPSHMADPVALLVTIPVDTSIQVIFTAFRVWSAMLVPSDPTTIRHPWLESMYPPLATVLRSGNVEIAPPVQQYLDEVDLWGPITPLTTRQEKYRSALARLLYRQLKAALPLSTLYRRSVPATGDPVEAYQAQMSQIVTAALDVPIAQAIAWWADLIIAWATTSPPVPMTCTDKWYESAYFVYFILEWLER